MVSFGWVLAASRRAPKSWSLRRGWNHHCLSLLWGSTSSSHWVVTHLDPFLLLLLQLQQYKSNKQKWILPTRRSQPEPNPLPLLNHTTIPHHSYTTPTLFAIITHSDWLLLITITILIIEIIIVVVDATIVVDIVINITINSSLSLYIKYTAS